MYFIWAKGHYYEGYEIQPETGTSFQQIYEVCEDYVKNTRWTCDYVMIWCVSLETKCLKRFSIEGRSLVEDEI